MFFMRAQSLSMLRRAVTNEKNGEVKAIELAKQEIETKPTSDN